MKWIFGYAVLVIGFAFVSCDDEPGYPVFPGNQGGGDNRRLLISLHNEGYYVNSPAWSPDCSKVAFIRSDSLAEKIDICIYDIATDDYVVVPNAMGGPYTLKWSPTDDWILYNSSETFKGYMIKPDGTDNTEIYPEGYRSTVDCWSPDGLEILFEGIDFDGYRRFMVADISDPKNIEYRDALLSDDGNEYYQYSLCNWGKDGELIATRRVTAFDGHERDYALCAFNPDSGYYEVLLPPETKFQLDYVCDWSPSGQNILLNVYDGVQEFWAYNPKHRKFTRITFGGNNELRIYDADWGKNGQIIFSVFDSGKYFEDPEGDYENIYVIDGPE